MKIQSLAIMFIILILPISLVLSSYIGTRIETIRIQSDYDTRLNNATYDALKAYQINSLNSDTSDYTNSKMRDIKASVNTFFNVLSSTFNTLGYTKETLQNFVPALVYTMYDGYYIYSPYENTWDAETKDTHKDDTSFEDGEMLYGLKPYVYYSCRYKRDGIFDIVITYSLDNYIQIQGTIRGESISRYGYLLDFKNTDTINGTAITYKGINIELEEPLTENICYYDTDGTFKQQTLKYIKNNGTKYYIDDTTNSKEQRTFTVLNGKAIQQNIQSLTEYVQYYDTNGDMQWKNLKYVKNNGIKYYIDDTTVFTVENQQAIIQNVDINNMHNDINNNNNAVEYYKQAYALRSFIKSYIGDLSTDDIIDIETGKRYGDLNKNDIKDPYYTIKGKIFDFDSNIEADTSNFNTHRIDVIKHSIVRNLSIAISNFNNYSGVTTDFQMPKLKDEDWDKIMSNISIISFLQGINIGGKVYNGYSIITNTKNEDIVMPDSIYILTKNDNTVHRVTENGLKGQDINNIVGIYNTNLERRSIENNGNTVFYYPALPINGTLSYGSIVTQSNIAKPVDMSLNNYIMDNNYCDANLRKVYYTALARERHGLYRQRLEI